MKRLIITSLFCSILFSACGQKKRINESTRIIKMKNNQMTSSNIVDKIYKNVRRYDKETKYFIRPSHSNCVYEILINDRLILKEYSLDQYATPININSRILKSGKQTVTVRLYPIGDALKRAYGEGETMTTLLPKTQMKIQVVKYDAFNIDSSLDAEKEVLTYEAPTDKSGKFIGAGLPYYEYSFDFKAKVPYELEGWTKGQDLSQFNKEELKAQVIKYYKGIQKIYETKDKDALARLVFGDYVTIAQTKYWNKQDIQEAWDEDINDLKKNIIEYSNKGEYNMYDMKFYGNGKLVALKHPSMEPVDKRVRGKSGFWFKYTYENRIKGLHIWYNLYLPEGEPLENLRVID